MIGRARELSIIRDVLDPSVDLRRALVVCGPAGIGKSALLRAAVADASERGYRTLMAGGVETESHLPLAGLHQLLFPVLDGVSELPAPQRDALWSAFGLGDRTEPDRFLIGLATLTLLQEASRDAPVVLAVDDAHWLDRTTSEVLAFVARRLGPDPIALLLATRVGATTPFEAARLEHLDLTGLPDTAARALLRAHAPGLAASVEERVLLAADGNPLGLIELPDALSVEQARGEDAAPSDLTLSERLRKAFAARLDELPPATRNLLLVAALNDSDAIAEAIAALGRSASLRDLDPAIRAALVTHRSGAVSFRHPLIRSAVLQSAGEAERAAGHAGLADIVGDPDRRIWHMAAASNTADERVAASLEAMAARSRARGSLASATQALERSVQLSPAGAERTGRMIAVGELHLAQGHLDDVRRVVQSVGVSARGPRDRGRLAALQASSSREIRADPYALVQLATAAREMIEAGERALALRLLMIAATSFSWADPGGSAQTMLLDVCRQMELPTDNPQLLVILAHIAPMEYGDTVVEIASQKPVGEDADALYLISLALIGLGAGAPAIGHVSQAATLFRRQGQLRELSHVLVMRAYATFRLGRWTACESDAVEGAQLAEETGQPMWSSVAQSMLAGLHGARGEDEPIERLLDAAESAGIAAEAATALFFVQAGRALVSASRGDHDDAYWQLLRVFDPDDPAHHPLWCARAAADLAESAVAIGRQDDARRVLARFDETLTRTPLVCGQMSVRHARAVLADDSEAEALFHAAFEADLNDSPFDRARLQLAFGGWLRRARRPTDSREPLRHALATFGHLRATPWCERASQELRAGGERRAKPAALAGYDLSPQERQVAQLAAAGLSNREIGERLFLSSRTVGGHLYRIFPKVGITSRHQLSALRLDDD